MGKFTRSAAKPPGHPGRQSVKLRTRPVAERKRAFLEAYATEGTIRRACEVAEVDHSAYYDWIKFDPQFVQDFRLAHEKAVDMAEAELRRRGINGVQEPVFYQGEKVAHVTRYSDACLIFYLKGRRGDVFRERTELTGADGGPVQLALVERLTAGRRRLASTRADLQATLPDTPDVNALPAIEGEVVRSEIADADSEG